MAIPVVRYVLILCALVYGTSCFADIYVHGWGSGFNGLSVGGELYYRTHASSSDVDELRAPYAMISYHDSLAPNGALLGLPDGAVGSTINSATIKVSGVEPTGGLFTILLEPSGPVSSVDGGPFRAPEISLTLSIYTCTPRFWIDGIQAPSTSGTYDLLHLGLNPVITQSMGWDTGECTFGSELYSVNIIDPGFNVAFYGGFQTRFGEEDSYMVTIDYAPEPSTIILFGTSLASVFILRRSRNPRKG